MLLFRVVTTETTIMTGGRETRNRRKVKPVRLKINQRERNRKRENKK